MREPLWSRFAAPDPEEQYKFGHSLVFFQQSLLRVGIVADEHGFYHASRHHGVVLFTFQRILEARGALIWLPESSRNGPGFFTPATRQLLAAVLSCGSDRSTLD